MPFNNDRIEAISSGRANIATGSNSAIVNAISTMVSCTSDRSGPHTALLDGQHIHVRSCRASSAGIDQPEPNAA